ncbi:sensor histidine kinase [Nonomuraea sp. NPDC050536]|uniref:sensor histidine kinase n=1 Tax=Nonomuraea sp. NPDC050536 TaxID=3364366 RepID=UPI0037CCAD17
MDGSPVAARAENAWRRSYPYWDAFFAVVLVATIVAIAGNQDPPPRLFGAVAALLLLAAAYLWIGRAAVRAEAIPARGSVPFAWLSVALFTAADVLDPATGIALSALVPITFMTLRRARAMAQIAALLAAPIGVDMLRQGIDPLLVAITLVIMLSITALLGTFIGRLSEQNTERARLIDELDRTRDELAAVSKEAGVLAERERLAGDIHDTLAQGFASIVMLLQAAEAATGPNRHLTLAVRTAKENLAETRALIAALTPPALAGASLEEAIKRVAGGFELPVEVRVSGPPARLGGEVEAAVVRAAQEGLANVRKHAGASTATVTLAFDGDRVRLSVTDDGRGFEPDAGGYGLRAMRSRVARLGGTVSVDSAPGRGATLAVELPCSE